MRVYYINYEKYFGTIRGKVQRYFAIRHLAKNVSPIECRNTTITKEFYLNSFFALVLYFSLCCLKLLILDDIQYNTMQYAKSTKTF
jgi:hypothetical protein